MSIFNQVTSLGQDECYLTEKERQSQSFGDYSTSNFFASECNLRRPMDMATRQPYMFLDRVGYSHVGAGGCAVDVDSNIRIGKIQNNPKARISLQARPFLTVPYLGKGVHYPVTESRLVQGDFVRNRKSCNTTSEQSFIKYTYTPMIPSLEKSIQNPANFVEGVADDGWIRGGLPTRELVREQASMN
jgi:hypothetical protein